jgi:hypothetical protein
MQFRRLWRMVRRIGLVRFQRRVQRLLMLGVPKRTAKRASSPEELGL